MHEFDCKAAAGILASGRTLSHVANAAAVIAGIACWVERGPALFLLTLSLALWLVESYFAARVAIDRSLFQTLAEHPEARADRLDYLLVDWKLLKTAKSRNMTDRIRGALKLLRMQSVALVLQLVALAGAIALRWVSL
jgi:hypothetical protein